MGTLINGWHYGFASAEIKLLGRTFVGIPTINFGDEVELTPADGNGSISLGLVKGAYKVTFDFEMLLGESGLFQAALGSPLVEKAFNCGIHFVEVPGAGTRLIEIIGAHVAKIDSALSRGPAVTEKYTCAVVKPILRDGRTLVADPGNAIDVSSALNIITG